MPVLAAGLAAIDLQFLGRPRAIASVMASGGGSLAILDPGPATTLAHLDIGLQQFGMRLADVRDILLTHVHLDHAGATGAIVAAHPDVRVWVHERGAPHLADPARLVASARRLWGDDLEPLWGPVRPVPRRNLRVIRGGERIEAGGRTFEVAYTPGHAAHHVSFFECAAGVAFVGDVAGMRLDGGYVMPPTPPPDIDLDLWRASAARIEAWGAASIFLTHFGEVSGVRPHFSELMENLDANATLVQASLRRMGTDEERMAWFGREIRRRLRQRLSDADVEAYEEAAPFRLLWLGLARYWRGR